MRLQLIRLFGRTVAGGTFVLAACSGCCLKCGSWKTDRCADIAQGAIPQPIGTYACQWQRTQQDRAERDDFVIYENEWFRGGTELGPGGKRHLDQLVERLMSEPQLVRVEPHYDLERNVVDEQRNDARVAAVVNALQEAGIEDADQFVILQASWAEPLYAVEGARLGETRLQGGRGIGGATSGSQFGGSLGSGGFGGLFGGGLGGGY